MSIEKATFGAGCFWCVEAIFSSLQGVDMVMPGYAGGSIDNPSYEEVCSGTTGHAEVCQITFDTSIIQFPTLLEVYWKTHDPTTVDRQGPDLGSQYRSVIFYHSEGQKIVAEKAKKALEQSNVWDDPIVTQIEPLNKFYLAEDYHKKYLENNPQNEYCSIIVVPKVKKFKKIFSDLLK